MTVSAFLKGEMQRDFSAGFYANISRQTKIFVYSKNRIFSKNPVFVKILCPKIYGTLLIFSGTPSIGQKTMFSSKTHKHGKESAEQ